MPKILITAKSKKNFEKQIDTEIHNIVDQCALIVARAESSPFGHVAEHLTGLRFAALYVRGLSGLQKQWQKPCLVISSIDVMPAYHRQGIFKRLLAELFKVCRDNDWVLKFENVIFDGLRAYLDQQGFAPSPDARGIEREIGSMYWTTEPQIFESLPQFDFTRQRVPAS